MYKSPISVECEKIAREITEKQDSYIVSETIRITGIKVDKDELIKALSYDRGQYEKGYADGKDDVVEIVRCRDCVMWDGSFMLNEQKKCLNMTFCTDGDFYCGWGCKE